MFSGQELGFWSLGYERELDAIAYAKALGIVLSCSSNKFSNGFESSAFALV